MAQVPVPPAPERFYSCVITLLELAGEASQELVKLGITGLSAGIIDTARGFLGQRSKDGLIQMFIEKGYQECWDKVSTRNSQFFLDNAERLFGSLQGFDLNIFQDVFRKDQNGKFLLPADIIADVWENLDAMIRISINYIHSQRDPRQVLNNGELANCYYNVFFPDIDLPYHAAIWKVELNFSGQ